MAESKLGTLTPFEREQAEAIGRIGEAFNWDLAAFFKAVQDEYRKRREVGEPAQGEPSCQRCAYCGSSVHSTQYCAQQINLKVPPTVGGYTFDSCDQPRVCELCKGTALCPSEFHLNQRHNIRWWFDEREAAVIDEIASKQELSRQAVLRQALRTYQLVVTGTHELKELNPMPKMAAAVGEGISAEQFYYEHRRKHKVDAHYNLVNMRGIFEFAEAYAGELRKERDALKQELQDEHDADKEIQEMMLKYQADAERAESALAEARSENKWISVSERLPNKNVMVLVANRDWPAGFPVVMMGHLDGLGAWCGHYADQTMCVWNISDKGLPTHDPTHWRPLPEPPLALKDQASGVDTKEKK